MSMGEINNTIENYPTSPTPQKKLTNPPISSGDSSIAVSPTLTFGTLTRPGVSFKNAVTPINSSSPKANVVVMSDDPSLIPSSLPTSNGSSQVSKSNSPKKPQENIKNSTGPIKFGSFPSNSLPPRVHSAPPSSSSPNNIALSEAPNRAPYAAGSFVPPTVNRFGNAPPPPMISGSDGMFVPPPPITSFIPQLSTDISTSTSEVKPANMLKKSIKISLVNPNTGKEVLLKEEDSKPVDLVIVEEVKKIEQEEISVIEEKKYSLPTRKSTIKLTLVDPRDNKPIDLSSLGSTPPLSNATVLTPIIKVEVPSVKIEISEPKPISMPTLEELMKEGDEDDDEILFSDDIFDDEDDDDDDDDYYIEDEDVCLQMLDDPSIEFPVILTREISKKVIYPEGKESFVFPLNEGDALIYSSEFLLQFLEHCQGVAQDIKAIAFPKEIDQMNNGRSRKEIDIIRRESGSSGSGSSHRKQSYKSHSSKRRNDQHQYSLEEKTLKNRAAHAWSSAQKEALDADIIILRDVKGLLNKLSQSNFDTLAQKICSMGILHSVAITGVIDLLFDKAVEEPKFAPLYANLCLHICQFEMKERLASLSDAERLSTSSTKSMFRKYLITKIQIEYEAKRAYSQARLEKLALDSGKNVEISSGSAPLVSGELTEADYAMIKTKRRVLGNMRFIGEIFIVGLISSNIMQHIITELLTEVEQPEEEEVESVCRLITTIGYTLDIPEHAKLWTMYVSKMKVLSENKVLPMRVRFMVLDVLELKSIGWKQSENAPPRKPPTPINNTSSTATPTTTTTTSSSSPPPKIAQRPQTPQLKRSDVGDSRISSTTPLSPIPIRVSQPSNNNRPRQSSLTPSSKSPSPTSKSPPPPTVGVTINPRFQVKPIIRNTSPDLSENTPNLPIATVVTPLSSTSPRPSSVSFDSKMLKKLVELFDESKASSTSKDAAIAIIIENNARNLIPLLSGLILQTMEFGGRKAFAYLCDDFLLDSRLRLNNSLVLQFLVLAFKTIDDFVSDVPMAVQFAAVIINSMTKNSWMTLSTLMSGPLLAPSRRNPNLVAKILLFWASMDDNVADNSQIAKVICNILPVKENRMALDGFATRIGLNEELKSKLLLE